MKVLLFNVAPSQPKATKIIILISGSNENDQHATVQIIVFITLSYQFESWMIQWVVVTLNSAYLILSYLCLNYAFLSSVKS